MYFQAFGMSDYSSLHPDLTYIVEHTVSQLLSTADVQALKAALEERRLTDVLLDELSFLGQIPDDVFPQVRDYLIKQEPILAKSAWRIVHEPDNDAIRDELCIILPKNQTSS